LFFIRLKEEENIMSTLKRTLVLTGPLAGKTMVLGTGKLSKLQFQFTKGRCTIQGSEKDVEGVTKYLGRCYKAYPEGSLELRALQEPQGGEADGKSNLQAGSESGQSEKVPGQVQSGGEGITQIPSVDGEGNVTSDQGETGTVPSGDGQPDSGVSTSPNGVESQPLYKAIMTLDPLNDEHWNKAGLPRVDVLEGMIGPDATRKNNEAVAPGYNREKAFELQSDEKK
jgi:hypothetical protein